MTDAFIGAWELIPELCLYQAGEPPKTGRYTIAEADGRIAITIAWTDAEDRAFDASYGAPADGSRQRIDTAGADAMSITRIDAHTLDSAAYLNGATISYARRRVSNDGALLVNVQEARLPDGKTLRNFQTYRRAP